MKKYYSSRRFKRFNKNKSFKTHRNKIRRRGKRESTRLLPPFNGGENLIRPAVAAPKDSRLLDNTQGCLKFIKELRRKKSISVSRRRRFITITLEEVKDIDYSFISVLRAAGENLKARGILLRGDFPKNNKAKQFIMDSGFLKLMYDQRGERFDTKTPSELLVFKKGAGKLSREDNIKLAEITKSVNNYLVQKDEYCEYIRTMLLEITGNAIEWSGTINRQWLLGVMYQDEQVVFTVTDVGIGIMNNLMRRHLKPIKEQMLGKSRDQILYRAFEKQYSSTSKEANRNKGLPCIKYNYDLKKINELKVLTNDVVLHFDKPNKSKTFKIGQSKFNGTFYRWTITADNLNQA